jgi:glycosyltransferase involved in cell wall biosynthesis
MDRAPQISVVVCTRNPRPDYWERVIGALWRQDWPGGRGELIVVDSASTITFGLPAGRPEYVELVAMREEQPGQARARVAGLRRARGGLVVFVDDDNELADDYLHQAWSIAEHRADLGVFGGSVKAELEGPEPGWWRRYRRGFAVEDVVEDQTGKARDWSLAFPFGAGLCVRSSVARAYIELCARFPQRLALGRFGDRLYSGDDLDLAICGIEGGLGVGRFTRLRLTHLISQRRLEVAYLVQLYAGFAGAQEMLEYLWPNWPRTPHGIVPLCKALVRRVGSGDWLGARMAWEGWRQRRRVRRELSGWSNVRC